MTPVEFKSVCPRFQGTGKPPFDHPLRMVPGGLHIGVLCVAEDTWALGTVRRVLCVSSVSCYQGVKERSKVSFSHVLSL